MPEDIQRIVDKVIELWNTGNPEIARQLYAESAERHDPNQPEPDRGPQQVARYIAGVRAGFPDFKLEIKQTVAEDNRLVTQWTCTGTQKGEFQGIPPTGKHISISGVTLVRIENGKVVEERTYFDRLTMLEQLGVAPGAVQSGAKRASG